MTTAVMVIAHGTVDTLDELPGFLANIRRGHPAPPELLAEVRRRYEAIGGRSPLNAICRAVAAKLEARTGVPTRMAMRLWHPYPGEVLEELAGLGVTRVVVMPLAQHSAKIYADAVTLAARELGANVEVVSVPNWGQTPALIDAYAARVRSTLLEVPAEGLARTTLILTAHSLPLAIVRAGDPYEGEVRASASAILAALGGTARRCHHEVVFQSQGMSQGPGGRPMEWLGPDLKSAIEAAAARGDTAVVVAPIGFLADHVEILYDLDIEACAWAAARGLRLLRTPSLNASDGLVDVLAGLVRPLLVG